jgi:predicted ArsR family transcriptional regulator
MNRNGVHAQARILSALERGPMSSKEVAARVYMSLTTVERHIKKLVAQNLTHLHGYKRSERGPFTRLYALGRGDGHVVQDLQPLQAAARCKAWRARGGDSHQTRALIGHGRRIAAGMTMAGLLLGARGG